MPHCKISEVVLSYTPFDLAMNLLPPPTGGYLQWFLLYVRLSLDIDTATLVKPLIANRKVSRPKFTL